MIGGHQTHELRYVYNDCILMLIPVSRGMLIAARRAPEAMYRLGEILPESAAEEDCELIFPGSDGVILKRIPLYGEKTVFVRGFRLTPMEKNTITGLAKGAAVDIFRLELTAGLTGCGFDLLGNPDAWMFLHGAEIGFTSAALVGLGMMFRRVSQRRGCNFRADVVRNIPFYSFSARIAEEFEGMCGRLLRDISDQCEIPEELEAELIELRVFSELARRHAIFFHSFLCAVDGDAGLCVRFCPIPSGIGVLHAVSGWQVGSLVEDLPADFSGAY